MEFPRSISMLQFLNSILNHHWQGEFLTLEVYHISKGKLLESFDIWLEFVRIDQNSGCLLSTKFRKFRWIWWIRCNFHRLSESVNPFWIWNFCVNSVNSIRWKFLLTILQRSEEFPLTIDVHKHIDLNEPSPISINVAPQQYLRRIGFFCWKFRKID